MRLRAAAGVEHHEALGGLERRHVREAGQERATAGDLGQLPEVADRMVLRDVGLATPEAVREFENGGHQRRDPNRAG